MDSFVRTKEKHKKKHKRKSLDNHHDEFLSNKDSCLLGAENNYWSQECENFSQKETLSGSSQILLSDPINSDQFLMTSLLELSFSGEVPQRKKKKKRKKKSGFNGLNKSLLNESELGKYEEVQTPNLEGISFSQSGSTTKKKKDDIDESMYVDVEGIDSEDAECFVDNFKSNSFSYKAQKKRKRINNESSVAEETDSIPLSEKRKLSDSESISVSADLNSSTENNFHREHRIKSSIERDLQVNEKEADNTQITSNDLSGCQSVNKNLAEANDINLNCSQRESANITANNISDKDQIGQLTNHPNVKDSNCLSYESESDLFSDNDSSMIADLPGLSLRQYVSNVLESLSDEEHHEVADQQNSTEKNAIFNLTRVSSSSLKYTPKSLRYSGSEVEDSEEEENDNNAVKVTETNSSLQRNYILNIESQIKHCDRKLSSSSYDVKLESESGNESSDDLPCGSMSSKYHSALESQTNCQNDLPIRGTSVGSRRMMQDSSSSPEYVSPKTPSYSEVDNSSEEENDNNAVNTEHLTDSGKLNASDDKCYENNTKKVIQDFNSSQEYISAKSPGYNDSEVEDSELENSEDEDENSVVDIEHLTATEESNVSGDECCKITDIRKVIRDMSCRTENVTTKSPRYNGSEVEGSEEQENDHSVVDVEHLTNTEESNNTIQKESGDECLENNSDESLSHNSRKKIDSSSTRNKTICTRDQMKTIQDTKTQSDRINPDPVEFHDRNTVSAEYWTSVYNDLDEKGIPYNTGKWSDEEVEQLKFNWKNIVENYPFTEPHKLFISKKCGSSEHKVLTAYIEEIQFYIQLGYGIRRSLFYVYMKAKRLFMPSKQAGRLVASTSLSNASEDRSLKKEPGEPSSTNRRMNTKSKAIQNKITRESKKIAEDSKTQSDRINSDPVEFHDKNTISTEYWTSVYNDRDEKGISYNSGKWSVEEIEQLKFNWENIVESCPFTEPLKLLNVKANNLCEYRVLSSYINDTQFYIQLGYGIRRSLKVIHLKARALFIMGNHLGRWTKEDTETLRKVINKKGLDFKAAAEALGRSYQSVRDKWRSLKPGIKKGPWSKEEDDQLNAIINELLGKRSGTTDDEIPFELPWTEIAEKMSTRNYSQCRLRWICRKREKFKDKAIPKVKAKTLVQAVADQNTNRESDIDWVKIQERLGKEYRPQYYHWRFADIVRKVQRIEGKGTFKETMQLLMEKYSADESPKKLKKN